MCGSWGSSELINWAVQTRSPAEALLEPGLVVPCGCHHSTGLSSAWQQAHQRYQPWALQALPMLPQRGSSGCVEMDRGGFPCEPCLPSLWSVIAITQGRVRRAGSSPGSEVCVQAQRGVQEGVSQVMHQRQWQVDHVEETVRRTPCRLGVWLEQLRGPLCWWEVALGEGKSCRLLWSWFGVLSKFTELVAPAEMV